MRWLRKDIDLKVFFLINSLGPGGAERSLAELLPGLRLRGVHPTILRLDGAADGLYAELRGSGVAVHEVGASWATRVRRVHRALRKELPALLHTSIFEADVVGRLAALRTRTPVLCSLVSTSYAPVRLSDPNIRAWRLRAVRTVDRFTARRMVDHFHAITHAVKDAAVRDLHLDPARITVIERGRDPERLGRPSLDRRAAARMRLGIRRDVPVLVTVGRQEFPKGQWHLIGAMPKVLASHPPARLLVAGRTGNVSGRLQSAIRAAGVEEQIDLLGHRDDVPEILAAADLFVFPSLYEGLGGALIEAMALGLPIVASDLPAIREVVEADRNAVLVPPGSSAELAAAIDALLADESRRASMGERSRRIFEERFTLERSATRMLELFERVAAEGRRRNR